MKKIDEKSFKNELKTKLFKNQILQTQKLFFFFHKKSPIIAG